MQNVKNFATLTITCNCENLILFMVRMTRISRASPNIRTARYSKKICKWAFCLSKFSLKLSRLGNQSMPLTSFQGIWFPPSLEMMVWYGWWRPQKILTPVSEGSNIDVSDKEVVVIILDGSWKLAKFEVKCRLVSSSKRRYSSEEMENSFNRDRDVASLSSGTQKFELDKLDELDDVSNGLLLWENKHDSPFRQPCNNCKGNKYYMTSEFCSKLFRMAKITQNGMVSTGAWKIHEIIYLIEGIPVYLYELHESLA